MAPGAPCEIPMSTSPGRRREGGGRGGGGKSFVRMCHAMGMTEDDTVQVQQCSANVEHAQTWDAAHPNVDPTVGPRAGCDPTKYRRVYGSFPNPRLLHGTPKTQICTVGTLKDPEVGRRMQTTTSAEVPSDGHVARVAFRNIPDASDQFHQAGSGSWSDAPRLVGAHGASGIPSKLPISMS
ncbi:hypothetical protein PVAG01_04704 [Phlyctema vagabunda]|uniref:Uncharacterized protein n=1 Tax=Phlyctema vagabunda TaxID=108571 RepID=A0ABR4PHY5_9HELO